MARIKCNINEMMAMTLAKRMWYSPIITTLSLKALIFLPMLSTPVKGILWLIQSNCIIVVTAFEVAMFFASSWGRISRTH